MSMIDLLSHLSQEDRVRVEEIDEEIYKLQGKLFTVEDEIELNKLYIKRDKIVKGG